MLGTEAGGVLGGCWGQKTEGRWVAGERAQLASATQEKALGGSLPGSQRSEHQDCCAALLRLSASAEYL